MERVPVSSSNLVSVGYDEDSKTLEIEFKSGVYQYIGIPKDIHMKLMQAPSKGQFVHRFIRYKYPTQKV